MTDDRARVVPSMIGMLHDVDVSTTPPTDGQALVWVDADKNWEPRAAGFDPNEDPVIIGAGATAGGGSTPSNTAGAHLHPVSIGHGTSVTGDYGVGVCTVGPGETTTIAASGAGLGRSVHVGANGVGAGYGATAGAMAVSIGFGTTAGDNDTTVGANAEATGGYGFAGGYDALCTADSGTAVGTVSIVKAVAGTAVGCAAKVDVGHDNSTAIGKGAHTNAADQIMIGGGTLIYTTVINTQLDVSLLPTADPGISGLVWNNAGALTVSP